MRIKDWYLDFLATVESIAFETLRAHLLFMARHLPGKVSRLIGDIRTLIALCELIEHELEKRIVARHIVVKLDSLLELVPRYKNELRRLRGPQTVRMLEELLHRLRQDYERSDLPVIRDAMSAHSLKLDMHLMMDAISYAGQTVLTILTDDIEKIEAELKIIVGLDHIAAGQAQIDDAWKEFWREDNCLGDPTRPRLLTTYASIATAGVIGPMAGGHPAQDALIRAISLATNLRQCRLMLEATPVRSTAERLFAEMILNDYLALWEALFISQVRNEYGVTDLSILEHWEQDKWSGAAQLRKVSLRPHPNLEQWRSQRNHTTAHLDPDCDIWMIDIDHWPMDLPELINEALRLIEEFRNCAHLDIRSRLLFAPPTQLGPDVIGLSNQEARRWDS